MSFPGVFSFSRFKLIDSIWVFVKTKYEVGGSHKSHEFKFVQILIDFLSMFDGCFSAYCGVMITMVVVVVWWCGVVVVELDSESITRIHRLA